MLEWSLDQEIANLLFQVWGSPVADLFAQCEGSGLLQLDVRTLGLSRRCFSSRLVKRSALHVPTDSAATSGSSQNQKRRSRRDHHPTVVAEERLVPAGSESTGRSAGASPSSAKNHKQSTRSSSPGSKYPPPSRLASLGETLQAEGVSAAAACTTCAGKRQSTCPVRALKIYLDRTKEVRGTEQGPVCSFCSCQGSPSDL